jgi:hypothetical protein
MTHLRLKLQRVKIRKLIAGEVLPIKIGVGFSRIIGNSFWTVMDIG